MAFRKPIGEDPRFKKASKFREELEREFPHLRELSAADMELTDLQLARFRQFVPQRVKLALEQEDEVLAEMVLALVEDKRELDPYAMLELLEPFIGKQASLCFVTETFQFIHALQQDKVSSSPPVPAQEQVKPPRQQSPSRTASSSPPRSPSRTAPSLPPRRNNRSRERRRREDDDTRGNSRRSRHRSRSPDPRRDRRTRRH